MKYALLAILAITLYLGVSCSPVRFNAVDHACTVSNPCVNAQGLMEVDQDFTFNSSNKVDILVIDDNSGSMTTEQNNLAAPFNGFINGLNSKGLDWQIGITNTDVCPQASAPAGFCPGPSGLPGAGGAFMGPPGSNPTYGSQYLITSTTPNPANVFSSIVQRGNEIGSGDERSIYAAVLATANKGAVNPGFLRDNSNLAIVILSDEDERSVGGLDTKDPGYAALETNDLPQTLVSQIASEWNGSKKITVYSIIVVPGDTTLYPDPNQGGSMQTCLNLQQHQGPSFTAHPGTLYQRLSQMTGGLVGSICDNGSGAFQKVLSGITGDIYQQMTSNTITLPYAASKAPVVTFNPSGNAVGWSWNGSNQIILSTRPADGTTVHVQYNFSSH